MLKDLALKHKTDKASHGKNNLSYCDVYEMYLHPFRLAKFSLIEIGVFGGASLRMWKEYFPHANIIGIDIDPQARKFEEDRIKIHIGSQDDGKFLKKVIDDSPGLMVVIDDGSHVNTMTVESFRHLWPALGQGGFYAIEDMLCSYVKLEEKEKCRETWPGMKLNPKTKDLNNKRKDMDKFLLGHIEDLDRMKGTINAIHFWPMQAIFLKGKENENNR